MMTKNYKCYKNVLRFREDRTYRVLEVGNRTTKKMYLVFYINGDSEPFTKAKLDRHFKTI